MTVNATSGAAPDTSGLGDNEKTYSQEFVEKLKKEKENFSKRVHELEAESKAKSDADLTQREEYKTLYEQTKAAKEKLETDLNGFKEQTKSQRIDAEIEKEFFKLGLKPEFKDAALKLVEKKTVNLDPETGMILGVKESVESFIKQFQSAGFFKQTAFTGNHSAPRNSDKKDYDLSKMSQAQKLEALRSMHKK